jgi:hypothetical protein
LRGARSTVRLAHSRVILRSLTSSSDSLLAVAHVNNLYNTTFWALILLPPIPGASAAGLADSITQVSLTAAVANPEPASSGALSALPAATKLRPVVSGSQMSTTAAHKVLQGSFSKDKHELLWERGISYGRLGEREKKGSILVREVRWKPAPCFRGLAADESLGWPA